MDPATLIARIEKEIQEQEPLFGALQEALSSCAPETQFAVRKAELMDIPKARSTSGALAAHFVQAATPYQRI